MSREGFKVSQADCDYLQNLLSKGQMRAREYKRATALLELNRGKAKTEIATTLGVSRNAVSSWAKRYDQEGLGMLKDKPRSGRPIEIDGSQRAKVTALACSDPPTGHSRWRLRLLADKAVELDYCKHLSHTQASEILKKTS